MTAMLFKCFIAFIVLKIGGGTLIQRQAREGKPLNQTESFEHSAILDPDELFHLFWNYNETFITFEIHVQTTGWIGIGFSPSGSMVNADIAVGWVKNGVATITDRHGPNNANGFPPLDTEQNVELLYGTECDGWTVIKFRRQLAACEAEQDVEITSDTLRIIYAMGGTDPSDDDITGSDYHGQNRGFLYSSQFSGGNTHFPPADVHANSDALLVNILPKYLHQFLLATGTKSMLILDESGSASDVPIGERHMAFDLLNDKFKVPAVSTYCNCRLFQLPKLDQKHHLVKVEPVIQPGNELHVHHILIYQCIFNVTNEESIETDTQCYMANMPLDFKSCSFVIQAWAIGGGAFYYPSHVGFALGTADAPVYVAMETHYDNPTIKSDIVDSSGLRFTYTPDLRQYDAGVMEVGHTVGPYQQLIPPGVQSYLNSGECSIACFDKAMELEEKQSLNAFAVLLHSHLLGKGMTLKHVRNGVELPYIAQDNSYDFNFQETRYLPEERSLMRGDAFQTVCNYDSTKRTNFTTGGLDASREMCLSYIYYYPKLKVTFCETAPDFDTLMNYLGFDQVTEIVSGLGIYTDIYNLRVLAPEEYADQTVGEILNKREWNEEIADKFAEDMRNMKKGQHCLATNGHVPINWQTEPLQINETFVAPYRNCSEPSVGMTTSTPSDACQTTITPPVEGVETTSTPTVEGVETTTPTVEGVETTTPTVEGVETTSSATKTCDANLRISTTLACIVVAISFSSL